MRALAVALLLSAVTPTVAQQPLPPTDQAPPTTSAVDTAAADAFAAANAKMAIDMSVDYTGNPDVAFVKAMIAHRQGAVDMANVILQFGEDEEITIFARKIIADQSAEIAWLRDWLAKHGRQ